MSASINRAFLLKTRTAPSETVDAGEAYFFLDGTSVKYKDDTQTIKTLATGVSPEDVQDIVGAFITSGNNRITAVYNDAGNSFVITLVEANIVHQNLSGAGTNTHAQIDSHIANTSNPHATTAAQVGADPTGSAAAAQAFAIQRSNHTGTQLASTISDLTEAAQDASASMITAATHDGVSVAYNDAGNSLAFTNTDKGTVARTAHEAAVDPHPQYLTTTEGNAAFTPISHVGSGGAQHANATTSVAGFMSGADKTKLDGIATGATANDTDANLRNRATHTGTQVASTISDLTEAVQDIVGPFVVGGAGITSTYNDAGNSLTIASTITQYTNDDAQDAVGAILTDTASIDFTYNDAGNQITAAVLPAGVNHDALQNFVANEHIDHSVVSINPGTGLTGGGDITATRTLNLANTAVTPGAYGVSGVPQITVDAQGRITGAADGPALVIGDNFQEFSDLTAFTTTANTNQVAASFTTTSKQAGKYRIAIEWDWSYNSTNNDAISSVFVDGVQVSQEFRYELSEVATQLLNNQWFYYPTFATTTTHTIELRVRSENAGSTHTVSQVRAEMWRVS